MLSLANYKEMYLKAFNGISKSIEDLQKLQQECEEIYLKNEQTLPVSFADDKNATEWVYSKICFVW